MSAIRTPAVLLLVFNRPEQTRIAIEALLREQPSKLYVSGDGPRPLVPTDLAGIEAVWDLVRSAPWQCEVVENRLQSNGGLAVAVRNGLDWFFDHEVRGLVVEDDVELGPGALDLAAHLFEAAEQESNVKAISLFNTIPSERMSEPGASFRRSIYSSSQGWGTWASVWKPSIRSLHNWREWLTPDHLRAIGGTPFEQRWRDILDSDAGENSATWDFTWQAYLFSISATCLVSNLNVVRNSGFTETATFSPNVPKWWPDDFHPWQPPFVPATGTALDTFADRWESRHRYGVSWPMTFRAVVARRVPALARAYRRARYGS